ncbi:peptidase M23 family protein [Agrobacterium rubi TR3 = NBRC 13261]|uniref:Peptidase M23 family protein n=2 Tax=Agrobacterium rubi TaxID=28099 RepID=A0A081CWJ3_9HYPH|nr:murein DD-endopeptidase MepM/ murein hydrolase activator NlpD [Agrobacterium rubi]GAK71039.1 peptidase M23 family protein [Agrobacterium rubi TR3 = NBRC 13261]
MQSVIFSRIDPDAAVGVSVDRVMRMSNSPKIGKSIAKMLAAALLASVATGCSSDATRFGGLFSSGPDQMTTASIPSRNGAAPAPVPQNDMNNGGGGYASSAPQGGYANQNTAMNQPYPASNGGYGSVQPSSARAASSSASVQRSELSAPSPSSRREPAPRNEAMAQPMPPARSNSAPSMASARVPSNGSDNLSTGSIKAADNGWHTDGASSVTLKSGETIATLSKRYGVPEKALLQANGLSSASAATPGQSVIIPKFGQSRNAARAASGNIDLSKNNNGPAPTRGPEQNVAVLPSQGAARDKASAEAGKLTPPGGKPLPPTGGYKVQAGDSLAKIARANGVSVADLKAANGITDGSVRIGQTLKIPGAGTDGIKTASVQHQAPAATKPVEAPVTTAKVEAPKAPAADASVSDVEKKSDMASIAPESTGIGKYRWPVRGAVISGFGENVDGSRNDGINISVPEGTPIKAAENGVVIYSGNGLKQLGNTVLIRHDDGRVTVYGNAANLEVQRGQKVQRGQTVATSGMTGSAKRPQVHFEVRKDATPVNPSSFLE